ncbi:MAG: outer membrane beta-barrel protein [Acidobacteria bacterium]|nr:outer membrane beta-barrel protein [Acidobacteriota bacterium]
MTAVSVQAQDRPVQVTVGGAIVAPLSGSADRFSIGAGADVGVVWKLNEQAGLKFDYMFAALGAKDIPISVMTSPIDVKPRLQFGSAAFMFQAPPGPVRVYLVGGVGIYRRSVTLTTPATGMITVCDPWWLVCYPQPVPVDRVVGSRSTTDFGVNVGAGFTAGAFFVEARYHYITGPSFDTPTGRQTATGKFFPLTIGVQF